MQRVRSTGAVVEVCPASNIRIAGLPDPAHHPVKRFLDAGLRVVVASDDPGILDTRLADEIATAATLAGADSDNHDEASRALAANAWLYRSELLSGRERSA
jgi:adenosine deaminase